MTEKEMASYFQEHRDDTSIWETESTPVESKKEPAVVFSVRFAPSELEGIRKRADGLGVTVASIIRSAVLEYSSNQMIVFTFGQGAHPAITLVGSVAIPSHKAYHCTVNSTWRLDTGAGAYLVADSDTCGGINGDVWREYLSPPPTLAGVPPSVGRKISHTILPWI
jgi:hypothetical protein